VFAFSSGIAIVAVPDVFEIYVPIIENDLIKDGVAYDIRDTLLKRISFLLDLNQLQEEGKDLLRFY